MRAKSAERLHSSSLKYWDWAARFISSAYMNLRLWVTGKSLVYRLNSTGARTSWVMSKLRNEQWIVVDVSLRTAELYKNGMQFTAWLLVCWCAKWQHCLLLICLHCILISTNVCFMLSVVHTDCWLWRSHHFVPYDMHTVNHKKRNILFLTITLFNLNRFF